MFARINELYSTVEQENDLHLEPVVWRQFQVRTLEKILEKEFDPERRPHDWACPDTEVDREDFIDLAKVSKQIPGKTPSQVKKW